MNRAEYRDQLMFYIEPQGGLPQNDRLAVLEEAREEIQHILNEAREAALEGWSPATFPNPCTEPDCVAEPGPRDEKLLQAELTIQKLEPKEGDVLLLIIKSDDVDAETVTRVRSHFRTFLADAACKKVVVLGIGVDDDIDAQVVKNEVIKEYLKAPLSPLEAIAKLTKALGKDAPPLPQGCGYPAAEVTAHVPSAPIPIDQVLNNVAEVDPEEDFAKRLGEEIKPETK